MSTKVTLYCKQCKYKARRELSIEPGSRGVHETSSEFGACPSGHGPLWREDGVPQERWGMAWDPPWMRQWLITQPTD